MANSHTNAIIITVSFFVAIATNKRMKNIKNPIPANRANFKNESIFNFPQYTQAKFSYGYIITCFIFQGEEND